MKRKKQGASLIVVIIVFMFISTVSMAMLSMVAGNYKARFAESKRIENLYASDSGLDVAYNIIGKTFDAATKYANLKVEKMKKLNLDSTDESSIYNQDYRYIQEDISLLKDDITKVPAWNTNHPDKPKTQSQFDREIAQINALIKDDENIKDALCNEEFKRAFRNFIMKHEYKTEDPKYDEDEDLDQDRLGNSEEAPNQSETPTQEEEEESRLKYLIEHHKYVSDVTDTDTYAKENIDFAIENKNNEPPKLEAVVTESSVGNSYKPTGISTSNFHHKNVSFTIYNDQFYDIAITSTFYTESYINNGEEKTVNERQLKATYKMLVPSYKDIYFKNSNEGLNDLATKDRALTIYGDMNVNSVNRLTVNGEMFVQGKSNTKAISDDRVYGKYFGGIRVNNSNDVKFEKNVITRGTFNVQTPTTVEDITPRSTRVDGSLYAKNIYVGNIDSTELPNQKSELTIGNGIINNDLTLNANNAKITIKNLYGINDIDSTDIDFTKKAESSSSIIVNGNNSSTIDIMDSAYLMGTAHIANANNYQTAESGAVKGNYVAYAVPLDEYEKFAYYDPLQLLEPALYTTQSALQVKMDHFINYWSQDGKSAESGGINWHNKEKIYSAGVIVYETTENGVKKSEVIPGKSTGDAETNGMVKSKREEFAKYNYKFGQESDNLYADYTNSNIMSFDSLIDTSKIPSKYNLTDGEYAIFNGDNEIKITKNIGKDTTEIVKDTATNVTNIKVGNNGVLKAVIATAGKVSIESDVTISGCIIAKGDLDINGDDVKINYDPGVIERVQSQNFDDFKSIFGESKDTPITNTDSIPVDGATNYDLKNFLENKLWKILK